MGIIYWLIIIVIGICIPYQAGAAFLGVGAGATVNNKLPSITSKFNQWQVAVGRRRLGGERRSSSSTITGRSQLIIGDTVSSTNLYMSDEAYYGEGDGEKGAGGKQGGAGGAKRRGPRPPPPRRGGSNSGGGGGGVRSNNRGRGGGGGVPQRDLAQLIERSGADGPEWKRAVNFDDLGEQRGGGGGDRGDRRGGGGQQQGRGRGGGGGRYGGGRRGGGGRGGRPMPVKKSWWTSEFNKMDGELEVPLPWWAMKLEMNYREMKVVELKEELQRRNSKVSGTKQELIERLEELDRIYSLSDEGFRQAMIIDDQKGRPLPACFPETYGDEFEESLIQPVDRNDSNVRYNDEKRD